MRSKGWYFSSLPLAMHWPQLDVPNLSEGFQVVFDLALSPPWWSHTDSPHSDFQVAFKLFHIFVLTQKNSMFLSLRIFFSFHYSFLCLYIFKSVYCTKLVLRATTNEISAPWESGTSSWWCCPTECWINTVLPLKRKSPIAPPHGIVSYSGISAMYLFNLVHLKYCVQFCCHLNDPFYFFSLFICIFLSAFQTFTAKPPSS